MRRPSEEHISDLKRILLRLSLLDGRLVWCVEGPHLTWLQAVHDPLVLLEDLARHGRPTVAGLQRSARMPRPPLAVDARWLGTAQRDLKALRRHPSALTLIEEARRVFHRHGRVDAAWLDARQQALEELSARLASAPPEGPASLYALAEALHGPGAARALERLDARSRQHGRSRRAEGRRRIAALLARLQPDAPASRRDVCEVPEDVLEGLARELLQDDRARGRAFERRLRRLLQTLVAWPVPPQSPERNAPAAPLPSALEAAVRAAGEEALAALRSTTHHEDPERLGRALGVLGLMFRVEPEDRLTPADVSLTLRSVDALREHLTGVPLTVRQVLELLRLDKSHGNARLALLAPLGKLVADGLELALVTELVRGKQAEGLIELKDDVEAARTWGQWVLRLSPTLRRSGNELNLAATAFRGLVRGRAGGLALLARCLLAHRSASNPRSLLAWLDATLGLVRSAPEQARTLHADLTGTAPGLGRRLFPEFAAWLGDEALLDRYCHLQRLAGEEPRLPRALLRDFEHAAKRQREREHLASGGALTEAQRRRLERLEQRPTPAAPPSPDWTLRRLRERLEGMRARAFEVRLDAALSAVLRAGWGINLPALTPAWRDAMRFHLSTTVNGELLGTLLRYAAAHPGQPIVRAMPANAVWLKRAAKRLNVDAWLAARRADVEVQGRRYVLSVEQNPIQVLRMGIPFNTCLSLQGGGNAASTVLNALDANKHVLYLRDASGQLIARKLIAVSRDWTLVGYRLYLALAADLRPHVERAFQAFCGELAAQAGLPLADSGEPEPLHPGFWYDDGTVPFTATVRQAGPVEEAVAAYCHHLGRPVASSSALRTEAGVWFARHREDVPATLAALARARGGAMELEAALWLVDRLGEAECLRLSASHVAVGAALLHRAFTPDAERMLAMLGRFPEVDDLHWQEAVALLGLAAPSEAAVRLLVDLARRHWARGVPFDDHGFLHGTLYALPPMLVRLDIATVFELCERIAPVWDWLAAHSLQCATCRDEAWAHVTASCERAWARRPDPEAVVRCLADTRRHVSTHRVALRLAARFPFPRSPRAPVLVPQGLTHLEGVPLGCPSALRVLRERCARGRELATLPEMAAALLRQSGPEAPVSPDSLPQPDTAPFEALSDLQLHLPEHTRVLLSRWDGAPEAHRCSAWTLHFHRRQVTTWRRALVRKGAGTLRLRRGWLAMLGDLKGLKEVFEQPVEDPAREKGSAPPLFPEGWRDAWRIAGFIARQVSTPGTSPVTLPRFPGSLPPQAVDLALVRRALRELDEGTRPGAPACGSGERLEQCIDILAQANTHLSCWTSLLEQLLDRGAAEALVARAAKAAFSELGWGLPDDLEGLMVRLAELPEARRIVVETFSRFPRQGWAGHFASLQLAARARGQDATMLLDEICAGWVSRLRGAEDFHGYLFLPPALLAALERAAIAQGPLVSLRFYYSLPSPGMASVFLDRMLAAFPVDAPRMKQAGSSGEDEDEDLSLRNLWLAAAVVEPC